MTFEELSDSEKLNQLAKDLRGMHDKMVDFELTLAPLKGNEHMGIKSVFDRIFDAFDELPCKSHGDNIQQLLTKSAVANGVNEERKKWMDWIKKYALPTGAVGGGISLAWKLMEGIFSK